MMPILSSLTFLSRLLGVDDPWLRQKLGISVLYNTGPVAKLLSRQWHNGCHFVSFVMYISGAKFEERRSNISRDILVSVFYCFYGTVASRSIIQRSRRSRQINNLRDTDKSQYFAITKFNKHFIIQS